MLVANLANLLAFSATAYGLAFDGPLPTTPVDDLLDVGGWSPKPTTKPSKPRAVPEIFRRQQDDGVCGYIEGDPEYPISCSVGDCYYNTPLSWFGCCTGTVTDSCVIATRCVPSTGVDACLADSSCASDSYITACTGGSLTECAVLYSTVGTDTVGHFVCASTSTAVEIFDATGTGVSSALLPGTRTTRSAVRASSTRVPTSSSESSSDEESSAIVAATTRSSTRSSSAAAAPSAAATSPSSAAAAAMQTARALVGGIMGVAAMLF